MTGCRTRQFLGGIFCSIVLMFVSALPAQAGMVTSDRILNDADPTRQALVKAFERDEIRAGLEQLGVDAEDARERVARLTDTEVTRLHQRLESLPAGGDLSTVELLLIIILIVLLV